MGFWCILIGLLLRSALTSSTFAGCFPDTMMTVLSVFTLREMTSNAFEILSPLSLDALVSLLVSSPSSTKVLGLTFAAQTWSLFSAGMAMSTVLPTVSPTPLGDKEVPCPWVSTTTAFLPGSGSPLILIMILLFNSFNTLRAFASAPVIARIYHMSLARQASKQSSKSYSVRIEVLLRYSFTLSKEVTVTMWSAVLWFLTPPICKGGVDLSTSNSITLTRHFSINFDGQLLLWMNQWFFSRLMSPFFLNYLVRDVSNMDSGMTSSL